MVSLHSLLVLPGGVPSEGGCGGGGGGGGPAHGLQVLTGVQVSTRNKRQVENAFVAIDFKCIPFSSKHQWQLVKTTNITD